MSTTTNSQTSRQHSKKSSTTKYNSHKSTSENLSFKAKQISLEEAKANGIIGERFISGFQLEDVPDDGNCFYHAIANQMKIINHDFIHNVPADTDINNSLRLAVQGDNFLDRQWADDQTFDQFVLEFPDVILAVVDTRYTERGFILYYVNDNRDVITDTGDQGLILPENRMIVRIAATGNHFLSVNSHPYIDHGALHEHWNHEVEETFINSLENSFNHIALSTINQTYTEPAEHHGSTLGFMGIINDISF